LHVVDFGDLGGVPLPFAKLLRGWLSKFHVAPRDTMPDIAREIAARRGLRLTSRRGRLGYFQLHVLAAGENS